MKNNNVKPEADAEILRIIKRESDKYFGEFFPTHKDSVRTFSDVKKLTGEALDESLGEASIVDALEKNVKLMVSVDGKPYPVLHVAATEWKSGVLFKRTQKGIFFVWNSGIESPENALSLSDLDDFLKSNGLSDMSSSVNCVGAAESDIKVDEVKKKMAAGQPLSFVNTDRWQACNVNYNLLSASYDDTSKSLVLNVEDRLLT